MKYIRFEDKNQREFIVTFPDHINHDFMAESIGRIKRGTKDNWHRTRPVPVSAGFVSSKGDCYGESFTLRLNSLVDEDTKLLNSQY